MAGLHYCAVGCADRNCGPVHQGLVWFTIDNNCGLKGLVRYVILKLCRLIKSRVHLQIAYVGSDKERLYCVS